MTTTERIRRHYQTLAGLKRRRRRTSQPLTEEKLPLNRGGVTLTPPPESPTPSQVEEDDDVIRMNEEEEEDEGEVLLALSESSSSATGSVAHEDDLADPKEAEPEEVMLTPSRGGETSAEETPQVRAGSTPGQVSKLPSCL